MNQIGSIKEMIKHRIQECDYQLEYYDGLEDTYSQEIFMRYLCIKEELETVLEFIDRLSK